MTTNYRITPEDSERLENDYKHHPPFGDQATRYNLMRDHAKALAYFIVSMTPKSREQCLALTYLELATFYGNAAISRHETPEPEKLSRFAGCYGGHDPNEVPDSEESGGDPVHRKALKGTGE